MDVEGWKNWEDSLGFLSMRREYDDAADSLAARDYEDILSPKDTADYPVHSPLLATVLSPLGKVQIADTLYQIDDEGSVVKTVKGVYVGTDKYQLQYGKTTTTCMLGWNPSPDQFPTTNRKLTVWLWNTRVIFYKNIGVSATHRMFIKGIWVKAPTMMQLQPSVNFSKNSSNGNCDKFLPSGGSMQNVSMLSVSHVGIGTRPFCLCPSSLTVQMQIGPNTIPFTFTW